MNEAIAYKIQLDALNKHLLTIECSILHPTEEGQVVYLPSWVPGSYLIRDFAKNLITMRGQAQGKDVAFTKITKNTWQFAACNGPLKITYQVYCFDLAPRGAYIDNTRVFFDGARIFLAVAGEEEQTRSVSIHKPHAAHTANWRCMTSMQRQKVDNEGFGTYVAQNHLELIDHPFEVSDFQQFDFDVVGIKHTLITTPDIAADWDRVVRDLQAICVGHVNFFGELPVTDRYVFFLNVMNKGYGGIEHRASCSLLCARNDLPIVGVPEMSEEYRTFLSLCSHEYFHLWNVKRIKPEVFVNPDLNQEVYTRQLWLFEGFTSYFDNLNLVRNEIISVDDYLQMLQKDINALLQNPGCMLQTLEDSSYDAWIKFYQPDENSINSTVSYYLKGSLVALALDLLIIRNSKRKQSLADVMQVLWQQYGRTGLGLPEDYFAKVVFEVTGEDYSDFLNLALCTTESLALPELLLEQGVIYKTKPAELLDHLGVKFTLDINKLQVKTVLSNTAAEQAGLCANDIIVAVNNFAVNLNNIEKTISRYATSNTLRIHVLRNDVLLELILPNLVNNSIVCELIFAENLSEAQVLNCDKWLTA